MAPHQKHYRSKMRKNGWMDENDNMIWPQDVTERQKMARGLFGLELISSVDYWTLLAEDELDNTYLAPWASPEKKVSPEKEQRREILKTLNSEQRAAVRDLLRYSIKGELHSFCVAFDQSLGGLTVALEHPNDTYGDKLEIHSPSQEEMHHEQLQWLEDFSIVFGEGERHQT